MKGRLGYYLDFTDKEAHLELVAPELLFVLFDTIRWCFENRLPCRITSIVRSPQDGISKSRTHQEGRAFDLGLKGWSEKDIESYIIAINAMHSSVGAVSTKGDIRLVVRHNSGHGDHMHIQVHSRYKRKLF